MSCGVPALGCGTNRFAPTAPEVSLRAAASRSAKTSAVRYPAATNPRPPALGPAAASPRGDDPRACEGAQIECHRYFVPPRVASSPERLAEEQAVLRLGADVRQHGETRQPAFECEPATLQQPRRRRVVDMAVRRHAVHGRVALGLFEEQLHHLGHDSLPPPSAAEAIAEVDDVRLRPSPAAGPDRATTLP